MALREAVACDSLGGTWLSEAEWSLLMPVKSKRFLSAVVAVGGII